MNIDTVMTQGARQTGTARDIDSTLLTTQIFIIRYWAVTKHFLLPPILNALYYDRVEMTIQKIVVPLGHMQNIENTNEKKYRH